MSVQKPNAATVIAGTTVKSSLKRRKAIVQAVLEKSGITDLLCEAVTAAYERGPVDPSKVVPFIIESCLEKNSESKRQQWPQPPQGKKAFWQHLNQSRFPLAVQRAMRFLLSEVEEPQNIAQVFAQNLVLSRNKAKPRRSAQSMFPKIAKQRRNKGGAPSATAVSMAQHKGQSKESAVSLPPIESRKIKQ